MLILFQQSGLGSGRDWASQATHWPPPPHASRGPQGVRVNGGQVQTHHSFRQPVVGWQPPSCPTKDSWLAYLTMTELPPLLLSNFRVNAGGSTKTVCNIQPHSYCPTMISRKVAYHWVGPHWSLQSEDHFSSPYLSCITHSYTAALLWSATSTK